MSGLTFTALDFETATSQRASVCEVGMCFVRDGQIMSSPSYLMRPPGNLYDPANIAIHGITPRMTADAPEFWLHFYPPQSSFI